MLGEVDLRCLFDAVDLNGPVLSKVNLVEVRLEDLLFRIARVEDDRHDRFLDLANVLALGTQIEILHELLRERRATGDNRATAEVLIRGARDSPDRDSFMPEEAPVFGGYDRIDEVLRH